jgi:hypothetical protein
MVRIQKLTVSVTNQGDRSSVTNSVLSPETPYSYREQAHRSSVPQPTVKAAESVPRPQVKPAESVPRPQVKPADSAPRHAKTK